MEIQADSLKLVCPRCGSEELIIESDTIKKERIRSHTVLESQRIQNEIEEKKLEGKKSDIVFELNKLTHEEKVKDKKYKQDVKEVKIGRAHV